MPRFTFDRLLENFQRKFFMQNNRSNFSNKFLIALTFLSSLSAWSQFNGPRRPDPTDPFYDNGDLPAGGFDEFLRNGNPGKDWTLLVFINGNNNLDSYGYEDMNEMEQVGSTDRINVVTQWASMAERSVKRILVKKDNDPQTVTSPVVQDMGSVDMGSTQSLIDFIRWGVENYPAKHYFIDVWNHGSGWHRDGQLPDFHFLDISFDDKTGHSISTEDLGRAMIEASQIIGHKVDIYGSDACLMQMAEVAGEMSNGVEVMVGSQANEPASGWPYGDWLRAWNGLGDNASARKVATALVSTYKKSYSGGSQGDGAVTLSALDLNKSDSFYASLTQFSKWALKPEKAALPAMRDSLNDTQSFGDGDYVDLGDFLKNLDAKWTGVERVELRRMQDVMKEYIISSEVSEDYGRSTGLSLWIPRSSRQYNAHSERYAKLNIAKQTHWNDVLKNLWKDSF